MRKVRNVNSFLFLSFFLLGTCLSASAQEKMMGDFYVKNWDLSGEHWAKFSFSADGEFEYVNGGDIGISDYGKGHYNQFKDSLILSYDLTDVRIKGYHIAKPYTNHKDSVEVKLSVFDFDKKPLSNVHILLSGDGRRIEKETNNTGKTFFSYKAEEGTVRVSLTYNYESVYSFDLYADKCYEVDMYFSKIPDTDIGFAIKNTVQKFKIQKIKKDFIELQTASGEILKLRRAKEDNTDDPFK